MSEPPRSLVIRLAAAQAGIPGPAGERAVGVFRRGPLDIALSVPRQTRQHTPHAQDELYFIVRGRGVLFHDGQRDAFQSGDLLFVAAGIEHQIEEVLRIWLCGACFTGHPAGRFPHSAS